jgi:hypothetical protein
MGDGWCLLRPERAGVCQRLDHYRPPIPITPKLISYKGWSDTNNDGVRDGNPTPSTTAILPAISGSGRIVAFLSRDPALNDPQGDGNGPAAPTPPLGRWLIYIHDRDADGNGTLDEAKVGGHDDPLRARPNRQHPIVRHFDGSASEFRPNRAFLGFLNLDGHAMATLVRPRCPKPIPTTDSDIIFSFLHPFCGRFPPRLHRFRSVLSSSSSKPSPPGIYVVDTNTNQTVSIQTNGVNGAPALSRDGNLLAFHSTMTGFRVNGGPWQPLPNKRNAVDDVFVFDLTGLPVWSTLDLRQANPDQFPPYAPCVNPALPSSSANLIAFQEIVNGASQVRVVNLPNTVLR